MLFAGWLVLVSACSPSIAPYSARAYEMAVDLKVDAIRTLEQAEEPYERHQSRVESLRIRMDKATEFARGRPKNEHATRQWELMGDPDGFMMGGFLTRWETEDSLTYGFIREARTLIAEGFDTIIGLESGKIGNDRR